MLDDLRNSSEFIEEEPTPEQEPPRRRPVRRQQKETFLGMTAQQRFVISLMLFVMVCFVGVLTLVITGSIALPFLR
jgi:hypothetical protein